MKINDANFQMMFKNETDFVFIKEESHDHSLQIKGLFSNYMQCNLNKGEGKILNL